VLGSAAGGGFPQWNCRCVQCCGVRAGDDRFRPRTQASIALTADGERYVLINASPDIRQQVGAFGGLHPRGDRPRGTPIAALLLTNADIDHIAGLLTLRESQPLALYATRLVRDLIVEHNAVFRAIALAEKQSVWTRVEPGREPRPIRDPEGGDTGLSFRAISVPGKLPAYLLQAPSSRVASHASDEETVAYRVVDPRSGRAIVYAPGIKRYTDELMRELASADCVLVDGTCFTDDELERRGISGKTSSAMGHAPISGKDGSMEALAGISARKIYIHINNTNPILDERSTERESVQRAGIEVAFDGMEIHV
jgi:pyrroloquinoline quinone biosynthesis protein B